MGVAVSVNTSTSRRIFFKLFFVANAEAMLFIDNNQSQIFKLHIIGKETVCADYNIGAAAGKILYLFLLPGRRQETAQK